MSKRLYIFKAAVQTSSIPYTRACPRIVDIGNAPIRFFLKLQFPFSAVKYTLNLLRAFRYVNHFDPKAASTTYALISMVRTLTIFRAIKPRVEPELSNLCQNLKIIGSCTCDFSGGRKIISANLALGDSEMGIE